MFTEEEMRLAVIEWEAWQQVIQAGYACGAWTKEQTAASVGDRSPHGKLFEAIRQWGERLVELRARQREEA